MTPDAMEYPELTERQERILAIIVREYTNKPEPVGSKFLSENYLTNVSSATIRNDMSVLEELGLVAAPHTSAGRVPTEAGFRYFVKRLLAEHDRQLPPEEQMRIADEMNAAPDDPSGWMQIAVSNLARASRSAALVTAPRAYNSQYKHLALISTHGPIVMLVLVLKGGDVRQQILTLAEPVPQEALSTITDRLNATCEGQNGDQVRARSRTLDSLLEREILDVVADTLDEADRREQVVAYRDGLSSLLPEFTESAGAQQALRLMEEQTLLAAILAEALGNRLDSGVGDVHVVIAGEGRWHEVRHLGMVLSRYGISGQAEGTLVAFGPTRMRYGLAISAVRYVAGLMSSRLVNLYGLEEPNLPAGS